MSVVETSGKPRNQLLPLLKSVDQWICWASHRSPFNSDKIPLNTASYNQLRGEFKPSDYKNTSIWMDYKSAREKASEYKEIDGVGFVLGNKNLSYVDIDNCYDSNTNTLDEEAYYLMKRFNTYTEISYSGSGIHILSQGNAPEYGWTSEPPLQIEVFDGSWVAITEKHVSGSPTEVRDSEGVLKYVCDKYGPLEVDW